MPFPNRSDHLSAGTGIQGVPMVRKRVRRGGKVEGQGGKQRFAGPVRLAPVARDHLHPMSGSAHSWS